MKVLIVTTQFPIISETFVTNHIAKLTQRGHETWVLALKGDESLLEAYNDIDQSKLILLQTKKKQFGLSAKLDMLWQLPKDSRTARMLFRITADRLQHKKGIGSINALLASPRLKKGMTFDVIHAHHGSSCIYATRLINSGFLQGSLIATFHGSDLNVKKTLPNKKHYSSVFDTAQICTVGTTHMKTHLDVCDFPEDRIRIIPMGVSTTKLEREKYQAKPTSETVNLITIGRLIDWKGIKYAVESVDILKSMGLNVHLNIVGDGDERQALEQLTKDLQISDLITFHGALPSFETIELLAQSDIMVHPGTINSKGQREGQGVVLAEAQSLRVPIVSTRVGGIPEAVKEGVTAILVEDRNPQALAESIALLAQDENLRTKMGNAGREYVEEHFDEDRIIQRWIELYHATANIEM